MNTEKTATAISTPDTPAIETPPHITMHVGKTNYNVNIFFNPNSRESIDDKIIRMLRNDVRNIANSEKIQKKW